MVRAAGVAVVIVFLALIARCWQPVWGFTAFLQLDSTNDDVKISAFKTYPVFVLRDSGGYDGAYYAEIAYHPTLRSPELPGALDNFGYRGRRILAPALAYALAAGRPAWIVHVYSGLNIGAWLVLALVFWRILPVTDWRSWFAWSCVLFSTGAIASVRLALPDLVAVALLAAAMLGLERSRAKTGAAFLAMAALTRETAVVAAGGLIERPWWSWGNAARLAIVLVPPVAWLAYVNLAFDSHHPGWWNLTTPVAGLIEKIGANVDGVKHLGDRALAVTSALATLGLVVQAAYLAVRPEAASPWWRVGAAYVVLMLCLNTPVWEGFPGAAPRVLLPMALAFNVLVIRRRAHVVWLIAGNLALGHGLLDVVQVPSDPQEFLAEDLGGVTVDARGADGWTTVRRNGRFVEATSAADSHVTLESWPHDDRDIVLDATVRSFNTVTLTVSDGDEMLWSGSVAATPTPVRVRAHLHEGRARLAFTASIPGAPPGAVFGVQPGVVIENVRLRKR